MQKLILDSSRANHVHILFVLPNSDCLLLLFLAQLDVEFSCIYCDVLHAHLRTISQMLGATVKHVSRRSNHHFNALLFSLRFTRMWIKSLHWPAKRNRAKSFMTSIPSSASE